ncbi:MAG TPA: LptE family protein [Paludibacteraceae bacterium]|nr:LptE family protein [Paludibacteraceae bacterium]
MTKRLIILSIISFIISSSCTISYKFNGASIDYSRVKSIAVIDFTNQATLVYPPMVTAFNEALKDAYTKQTRLTLLKRNGDLELEGEITDYTLTPLSIGSDAYAAETRLTMTVRVRFTNNTNTEENFERTFSANRTFPSSSTLESVQDQLVGEMIEEIVDNIYNATVANW